MVLSKLFLEDEQVVYIVEDAVEVAGEQVRLYFLDHLLVTDQVDLTHLLGVNRS